MDITTEKAEILKRLDQVNDLSLVSAVRNLLDFGLSKQNLENNEMENSINRGLQQAERGELRPHEEVIAEIRDRYKS
jgi:predicted transcriptional regulator